MSTSMRIVCKFGGINSMKDTKLIIYKVRYVHIAANWAINLRIEKYLNLNNQHSLFSRAKFSLTHSNWALINLR